MLVSLVEMGGSSNVRSERGGAMEESTGWVRAQRREGVLELTLSRPERANALAGPMVEELRRAIDGASSDDVTRVVLLRAEGKDFCTGIDLADLDDEVGGLVEELGRSATVSVGLARRLLSRNLTVSLHEALENEATTVELATRSDDFKEGMRAFMDKRPPEFTGR